MVETVLPSPSPVPGCQGQGNSTALTVSTTISILRQADLDGGSAASIRKKASCGSVGSANSSMGVLMV
jgi:hypothetical protein